METHLREKIVDPGDGDRFGKDGAFLFCSTYSCFGVFVEGGEGDVVWEEDGLLWKEGGGELAVGEGQIMGRMYGVEFRSIEWVLGVADEERFDSYSSMRQVLYITRS